MSLRENKYKKHDSTCVKIGDTVFTIALKNDKYVDSLLLCQYWKGTRMFGMEPQKRKVRSVCAPKANKGNMFVSGIEYRTP